MRNFAANYFNNPNRCFKHRRRKREDEGENLKKKTNDVNERQEKKENAQN
jgi:hypothetical protein